jgi:hypothetical protein
MHAAGAIGRLKRETMTDTTTQEPTDRSLAALYDDPPAAPAQTPQQGTGEPPQQQAPATEPAAPATDPAAPPAADANEGKYVPVKALEDERRKRQALERKFQDLERRVPTPAREAFPDPIVDPDAYADAVAQRQSDERFVERVNQTREDMIDSVGEEKFLAAEAAFAEAAAADPQFGAKLRAVGNPARFAYREGTKLLEARDKPASDASSDLYAKMKAQLEAEFDLVPKAKPNGQQPPAQATAPPQQRAAPRLPTSLADVPAGGPKPQTGKPSAGDIDLAAIYGD